jgi:hypothetical protein
VLEASLKAGASFPTGTLLGPLERLLHRPMPITAVTPTAIS